MPDINDYLAGLRVEREHAVRLGKDTAGIDAEIDRCSPTESVDTAEVEPEVETADADDDAAVDGDTADVEPEVETADTAPAETAAAKPARKR